MILAEAYLLGKENLSPIYMLFRMRTNYWLFYEKLNVITPPPGD